MNGGVIDSRNQHEVTWFKMGDACESPRTVRKILQSRMNSQCMIVAFAGCLSKFGHRVPRQRGRAKRLLQLLQAVKFAIQRPQTHV